MGIMNFIKRKAAQHATRNLPKEQQELIMKLMEQDPKLFENIAKETQELVKQGKPEMYAGMEVMKKYEKELREVAAKAGVSQTIQR